MTHSLLADVVDIQRWLDADAERPADERLARDRAIGRNLPSGREEARVLGWWRQVAPAAAEPTVGERLVALRRLVTVALFLGGFAAGVGIAAAAFAYDGRHPVNLLALLGILVGIPLALLLVTLISLLPLRVPGLARLKESLGVLNPGRWAGEFLDRRLGMTLHAGFGQARGAFARWQLLVFSQWLAVGYFLGVIATGLVLVTVSDLAFGWSSTLELDARTVHRLFQFLALPWQFLAPEQVPDLALVEASRYFRLEGAGAGGVEAERLGSWWPFVLLTIVCWGLLPRLLLLAVGLWRLQAATRALLVDHPEVLLLLDRLAQPRLAFEAPTDEEPVPAGPVVQAPVATGVGDDRSGPVAVVIWNDVFEDADARTWVARNLGREVETVVTLSSRTDPAQRQAALSGLPADLERLVLICKGWEPPLLEFADLLTEIRAALGPGPAILVVPVNTRRSGVDAADQAIWARFLARHGTDRVYIQPAEYPAPQDAQPGGSRGVGTAGSMEPGA